jgi:hypothetical protein
LYARVQERRHPPTAEVDEEVAALLTDEDQK